MIYGIGTDLARIVRFGQLVERHGRDAAARRILAPVELADYAAVADPARFLAKRFAAKEALGKALGTGIRVPVLLTAIAVTKDALGKPGFALDAPLQQWLAEHGVGQLHLSISDEVEHALAFVVAETA
ncbi:holo-ACP synthase [Crenobacter sp. SG2305]|uniref:holo-ACP synthase n=1 Tax=Crenobacter oryzisoli TaxID=3056844 RepID=UPI0025AACE76|nr:holo-ACP synthase [Crenobacter sp. SG2305]MDN0085562.1 holo-ACP synthase [Crenobacter sp. SG2305]